MIQPSDFHAQALRCRAEAEATNLPNVRDQCLRAEAAWLEMAQRHERTISGRARRETQASEVSAEDPQRKPT